MKNKIFYTFLFFCLFSIFISNNFVNSQPLAQGIVKGCEPFEFKTNSSKAVLLLHGLGGCPYEIRTLGEFLNKNGYSVIAPLYPGHGTNYKNMGDYKWKDWYNIVEKTYLDMKKEYKSVYLIGFSTGGTLSLYLSQHYPVEKMVLLSPFIYITYKWYYGLRPEAYLNSFVGNVTDYVPSSFTIPLNDPKAKKDFVSGTYFSFSATRSALELIDIVKKNLSQVNTPTLIMQSKGDDTVDIKSSKLIYESISSKEKKYIVLEKSNHLITRDYEKDIVFDEVKNFLSDANNIQ